MDEVKFERGQVWYVDFDNGFGGNIASGRPVLVLSSAIDCERNDYIEVAVMTRQDKKMIVNVPVVIGSMSGYVVCNNINSVEKSRLRDCRGKLSAHDMSKVEEGILIALGMKDARSTETAGAEVVELTVERDMYKRLYERALEKLVESAYARESQRGPVGVAPEPEPPKKKTVRVLYDPAEPESEPEVSEEPLPLVDVNTCEESELLAIGLNDNVARYIVRNRPFKSKDDLRHVPSLSARMYQIVKNKVTASHVEVPEPPVEEPVEEPESTDKVNINTCTAHDLVAIGMYRSMAYSITGYRNKNGAYGDVLDLLKVPRMSVQLLEKVESRLEV